MLLKTYVMQFQERIAIHSRNRLISKPTFMISFYDFNRPNYHGGLIVICQTQSRQKIFLHNFIQLQIQTYLKIIANSAIVLAGIILICKKFRNN